MMRTIPEGTWRFSGEIGRRLDANVDNWLLRAPDANPGLLDMFRRRDRRQPAESPLPWSGEFAGKYLISAVQACRTTDNPELQPFIQRFVDALVETQAPNGYMGAFPESEQLLGHWDLWNHHHIMTGLLMWRDMTGSQEAFDAAVRAADLVCRVYLDGALRPINAGDPECNFAILTVMLDLFRRTENPRYRELAHRIEEDMQHAGDWLRRGAAGELYCNLPNNGTRWESLHIVQSFATLYELTGKEVYKDAAVRLWESLRSRERHPSGAFSTHERAYGTPYAEGSIETCCSIAWAALSIDILRLTGDPRVADELELTTWNQFLAAQHPSGSWCTYDNQINGFRMPSFHSISFQVRPGGGELNCCSVNAPRGLGMLADWAVMQDDAGLAVNFYGPMETTVTLGTGERIAIRQETEYPLDGRVRINVAPSRRTEFTLRLRIPEWSAVTSVTVNGEEIDCAAPGSYAAITRVWRSGDHVELTFDMGLRHWAGDARRKGFAALYAGPLLLAFDARHNAYETGAMPAIDLTKAALRRIEASASESPGHFPPMGLWALDGAEKPVVLCDFGSAGAHGTDYAAWLPAVHTAPPPIWLESPPNGAKAAPGPVRFAWTSFAPPDGAYDLVVARDASFEAPIVRLNGLTAGEAVVDDAITEDGVYYWKVSTENAHGRQTSRPHDRHFVVDSSLDAPFAARYAQTQGDEINARANPFQALEGTYILGVKNDSVSFDEERWLEYPNASSIDGAGFFSPEKDTESPFTWRLEDIPPGAYELDAWIPVDPHADHARDASCRIVHAQAETIVEVNLARDTHAWRTLGVFVFDAHSRVEMSNLADRFVAVEGIRLRKVNP